MFDGCPECLHDWDNHATGCPNDREYWRKVDAMPKQPRPHNPAIDTMIDSFDGADPWGSAMAMAFAVAEVGRAIDHPEPGQILNYRPSAVAGTVTLDDLADNDEANVDYETESLALAVRAREVTEEDLTMAARILNKYLNLCKLAGKDY